MNIVPYTEKIEEYLVCDDIIDYDDAAVAELADRIYKTSDNDIGFIKNAYEYVRDNISHSADINEDAVTCKASEVLKEGHGICFAKSHLLAAILRSRGIPAGFCYQKLILDDETAPVLIYHGLNGVYIEKYQKWIRLDARGNKPGVDAQFSVDEEKLAFPIRPEKGETDGYMVYPHPDKNIVKDLRTAQTRSELWEELPNELAYGTV